MLLKSRKSGIADVSYRQLYYRLPSSRSARVTIHSIMDAAETLRETHLKAVWRLWKRQSIACAFRVVLVQRQCWVIFWLKTNTYCCAVRSSLSYLTTRHGVFRVSSTFLLYRVQDDVYGGTNRFFRLCASRMGIESTFVDMCILDNVTKNLKPNTEVKIFSKVWSFSWRHFSLFCSFKMVWLEVSIFEYRLMSHILPTYRL